MLFTEFARSDLDQELLNMIRELNNSIKAVLYERATSPLSGVVAIVWAAFNWKALAVFFLGKQDISDRITFIESHYVESGRNIWWPLVATAVVVVVYPFLALAAYALWEKVSAYKMELKQRFDGTVALSVDKSVVILKEMRDQKNEFKLAVEAKDSRISELEAQNEQSSNELGNLKDALRQGTDLQAEIVKRAEELTAVNASLVEETHKRKELEERYAAQSQVYLSETQKLRDQLAAVTARMESERDLSTEEEIILREMAESEDRNRRMSRQELTVKVKLSRSEANYYLENLKIRNFIRVFVDRDGDEVVALEQPGRAYLMRRKQQSKTPSISKAPSPPSRL